MPAVHHAAYVAGLLTAYVIEFEYLRVMLSAIYAGMRAQIFYDVLSVFRTIPELIRVTVRAVLLGVGTIQFAMVNAIAITAKVMPNVLLARAKRKDRERQHPRALSTRLHTNICSLALHGNPIAVHQKFSA